MAPAVRKILCKCTLHIVPANVHVWVSDDQTEHIHELVNMLLEKSTFSNLSGFQNEYYSWDRLHYRVNVIYKQINPLSTFHVHACM